MMYIPWGSVGRSRRVIFFLQSFLVEIDEMPAGCLLLASSHHAFIYVRCSLLFLSLLSFLIYFSEWMNRCPLTDSSVFLTNKKKKQIAFQWLHLCRCTSENSSRNKTSRTSLENRIERNKRFSNLSTSRIR